VALDPFILQHTMNPKAVQPRFLNDDDRKGATRFEPEPSPEVERSASSSPATLPPRTECFDIFFAAARRQRL